MAKRPLISTSKDLNRKFCHLINDNKLEEAKELIITNDLYGKLSNADFGINSWKKSFNTSQQLFNQRYKPPQTSSMPNYPQMYSLSGEFKGDGPLPSNY